MKWLLQCAFAGYTKRTSLSRACLILVLTSFCAALLVSVGLLVYMELSSATKLTTKLGHRNDTTLLEEVSRFSHSEVTVARCDQTGDYAHANEIYLVKKDEVTIHERIETFQSIKIDQTISLSITGIVNYLYLLPGSEIEYTLCIGSEKALQQDGKLFIFDDDANFFKYQNSPELGEQLSVFSMELVIGRSNQVNCMTVRYQAPNPSYYFIASRTPAGIFYEFNYTNTIQYFKREDYPISCTIDTTPCSVSVPGHLFENSEYVLLTYTVPNEETTSVQTHLCVTTNRSDTITLIVALCGSIAGIAILAVSFIIFVQCFVWYRGRNRKGYVLINSHMPTNVGYRYY